MAKHLIVCCDGTWNHADQRSRTNVSKIALSLRSRAAGCEQRVYYHRGVGNRRWTRLRGGAFGMGLSRHVLDAYRFLVDAYEPGDKLYLFGFSRGAYTARSLAGMVRNCGILRQEHSDMVKKAWALYRDRKEKPSGCAAVLFRRAYAHETDVHFIGVWDTVGALGIPGPRLLRRRWEFHDTKLSGKVRGAFHALAIDEQRGFFEPTLWCPQPGDAEKGQEVRQVWFAGVHTDVGGGSPKPCLSDVTLLWMAHQAHRYGLEFDPEAFSETGPSGGMNSECDAELGARPKPTAELHRSRGGLYVLFPRLHRRIGAAADDKDCPDGREYVAQTAKDRYDDDASYRPPGLHDYLTQAEVRLEPVSLAAPGMPSGRPNTPGRSEDRQEPQAPG
ncbi:DUF2235 domain-containing protein [Streptomyces sp. O3]